MAVRTLILCQALLVAGALASKISPTESVVNLIEKLKAQTEAEGKKEAAAYDKYACFCKEQADGKLYAITTATSKLALLEATIKELAAAIVQLNKDIKTLNKEIDSLTKKCEDEQAMR